MYKSVCSGCKSDKANAVYECSRECQIMHWKYHNT